MSEMCYLRQVELSSAPYDTRTMAIIITSAQPRTLLKEIREQVHEGRLRNWRLKSGKYLAYVGDHGNEAWLSPEISINELRFEITGPEVIGVNREMYAIYHGRFIETLLSCFTTWFTEVRVTAL